MVALSTRIRQYASAGAYSYSEGEILGNDVFHSRRQGGLWKPSLFGIPAMAHCIGEQATPRLQMAGPDSGCPSGELRARTSARAYNAGYMESFMHWHLIYRDDADCGRSPRGCRK